MDIYFSQVAKERTRVALARVSPTSPPDGHLWAYVYSLVLSAYPFAKVVAAPFLGFFSDLFGRRATLTFTFSVTAICLALTGLGHGVGSFVACRLLTGVFANGGLLTAYAADIAGSDYAERTQLFSFFTTA